VLFYIYISLKSESYAMLGVTLYAAVFRAGQAVLKSRRLNDYLRAPLYMPKKALACGFVAKCSCPARQLMVKQACCLLKKRDFSRVKSHYRVEVFAPMIAMKCCHRGFLVPFPTGVCLYGVLRHEPRSAEKEERN